MIIFWGSALVYVVVVNMGYMKRLTSHVYPPRPIEERQYGQKEPWPQTWLKKRQPVQFWRRIHSSDLMERKLLQDQEEDNMINNDTYDDDDDEHCE